VETNNYNNFKKFDAHLHTHGSFLPKGMSLVEYINNYKIEKAFLTTINRAARPKAYIDKVEKEENDNNKMRKTFDIFKKMMPKEQLDHQDVIDLSKKSDLFIKFFWFNPKMNEDQEENDYQLLEKHFNEGFSGVKLHPVIHLTKIPRDIKKLAAIMQERKKILFIHSHPKTSYFGGLFAKDIVSIAEEFPDLKIIVGHAGYAMEYAIDLGIALKKHKNVYYETSCSIPFALLSIIKIIGHERMLFGSDAPITNPLQIEIDKISCLPISDDQKEDIFYNNAISLLRNM
jgi:predicted TIM-barrel fold metal-dependent hydrolase